MVAKHPDGFLCPISLDVMRDPVVTLDGHSYERSLIVEWLRRHNRSPLTNQELPATCVTANIALRNAIEAYSREGGLSSSSSSGGVPECDVKAIVDSFEEDLAKQETAFDLRIGEADMEVEIAEDGREAAESKALRLKGENARLARRALRLKDELREAQQRLRETQELSASHTMCGESLDSGVQCDPPEGVAGFQNEEEVFESPGSKAENYARWATLLGAGDVVRIQACRAQQSFALSLSRNNLRSLFDLLAHAHAEDVGSSTTPFPSSGGGDAAEYECLWEGSSPTRVWEEPSAAASTNTIASQIAPEVWAGDSFEDARHPAAFSAEQEDGAGTTLLSGGSWVDVVQPRTSELASWCRREVHEAASRILQDRCAAAVGEGSSASSSQARFVGSAQASQLQDLDNAFMNVWHCEAEWAPMFRKHSLLVDVFEVCPMVFASWHRELNEYVRGPMTAWKPAENGEGYLLDVTPLLEREDATASRDRETEGDGATANAEIVRQSNAAERETVDGLYAECRAELREVLEGDLRGELTAGQVSPHELTRRLDELDSRFCNLWFEVRCNGRPTAWQDFFQAEPLLARVFERRHTVFSRWIPGMVDQSVHW